jgi:hypothetical protein
MRKFLVIVLALAAFTITGHAGPVAPYRSAQEYSPSSQDWFHDREWNFDLFGTYAFTAAAYRNDRFLGVDHAWGGGLDVNYMFSRYLGLGIEGYGVAARDAVGQASGNLILRYPISGSRFAPYAFAGGGVIFNGSQLDDLVDRPFHRFRHDGDAEGMGQFGAGVEIRLTPNFGLINDFSWNVVGGDQNDFGMVRSGMRFSF